jgi:hypothetical protein
MVSGVAGQCIHEDIALELWHVHYDQGETGEMRKEQRWEDLSHTGGRSGPRLRIGDTVESRNESSTSKNKSADS